jgi:dTDP-glucose pyrophosphorylase
MMLAAILAAGRGTRMRDFSDHWPKPALPVCNKPLLQYQIEILREIGIREILIVIGHLGHEIAQVFGDGGSLGVRIKYVEQSETLGIANALGQLEPYVSAPLFLLLGDIFFVTDELATMIDTMTARRAGAVLAVKREQDPEAIKRNFTILLSEDGSVRRVIEKPRHSTTNIKGCGLYLFDLPVFDAVRRTPRTAMRDEYEITDTIQIMIDDGLPVFPAEIIQWDMNLSVPPDLLECNLFQMKRLGVSRVIGEGTQISEGATIDNAVLGARVVIQHPIRITSSVIFPDTVVSSTHDIDRFILTPRHQIDCRTFT